MTKNEAISKIINLVRTKPKMVGLKIIYKEFKVPKEKRQEWRDFWDEVRGELNARQRMQGQETHADSEQKATGIIRSGVCSEEGGQKISNEGHNKGRITKPLEGEQGQRLAKKVFTPTGQSKS